MPLKGIAASRVRVEESLQWHSLRRIEDANSPWANTEDERAVISRGNPFKAIERWIRRRGQGRKKKLFESWDRKRFIARS